jgi:hypothetical protein
MSLRDILRFRERFAMVSYKIFDIVALPEDTIDTATSNDSLGPLGSEMAEIADKTFNKYGHLDIDTG